MAAAYECVDWRIITVPTFHELGVHVLSHYDVHLEFLRKHHVTVHRLSCNGRHLQMMEQIHTLKHPNPPTVCSDMCSLSVLAVTANHTGTTEGNGATVKSGN